MEAILIVFCGILLVGGVGVVILFILPKRRTDEDILKNLNKIYFKK
ncbi:hypothetical protein [Leptospira alexanderi]|nr:hypothetical protein [Leptospira alexanderi]